MSEFRQLELFLSLLRLFMIFLIRRNTGKDAGSSTADVILSEKWSVSNQLHPSLRLETLRRHLTPIISGHSGNPPERAAYKKNLSLLSATTLGFYDSEVPPRRPRAPLLN